jgi:hypothetical protein
MPFFIRKMKGHRVLGSSTNRCEPGLGNQGTRSALTVPNQQQEIENGRPRIDRRDSDDRNATHTGNSAKPSAGQKQPGHRC